MGKIDELMSGFSEVIKGPYEELEQDEQRRRFDFQAPNLHAGQGIIISASERKSGTIDLDFEYVFGQITSPDCYLDLLKMNYFGIKGPYFASIIEVDDPDAYMICLRRSFNVPSSTTVKDAVDVFKGDYAALMIMPTEWPDGVEIWDDKKE